MPSLSIKDVPEPLLDAMRQRAARNHRSLQGELMALIVQAAEAEAQTIAAPVKPTPAQKSIEQIAAEHRARWPQPLKAGPRAVDIIRAERDAR